MEHILNYNNEEKKHIKVSFLQIYDDELIDSLLVPTNLTVPPPKLRIKQKTGINDGTYVEGLTSVIITNMEGFLHVYIMYIYIIYIIYKNILITALFDPFYIRIYCFIRKSSSKLFNPRYINGPLQKQML